MCRHPEGTPGFGGGGGTRSPCLRLVLAPPAGHPQSLPDWTGLDPASNRHERQFMLKYPVPVRTQNLSMILPLSDRTRIQNLSMILPLVG